MTLQEATRLARETCIDANGVWDVRALFALLQELMSQLEPDAVPVVEQWCRFRRAAQRKLESHDLKTKSTR